MVGPRFNKVHCWFPLKRKEKPSGVVHTKSPFANLFFMSCDKVLIDYLIEIQNIPRGWINAI